MSNKKPPTTPETLKQSILADDPPEGEMQESAPAPCNLDSEELKKAIGEKALELLSGGCRIVNVKDVPKIPGYTFLTVQALRHMIFAGTPRPDENGNPLPTNGFDEYGVIIAYGKGSRQRTLVCLNAFDRWLDAHRVRPLPNHKKGQ